MNRLNPEARMTIKTLAARGATNSHIARLLGVTEGAVRHHVARLQTGALDGRSRQEPKAACVAAAIDRRRQMQDEKIYDNCFYEEIISLDLLLYPRCGSLRQAGRLLWRVRHARGHSQVALKGLSSSGGQAGRTFSRVDPRVTA